jgi:hypothetical protein
MLSGILVKYGPSLVQLVILLFPMTTTIPLFGLGSMIGNGRTSTIRKFYDWLKCTKNFSLPAPYSCVKF